MLKAVSRLFSWPLTALLALAFCSQSVIAQTGDANSLLSQGNSAMRKGDAAEAVRNFQQFLKLQPSSAEGYFNLGLALESNNQFNDALTALHKAASLQPGLRGVQLFTGIVDYKLNHFSEAHSELIHETRLEPKNAAAGCGLALWS
jgi:Flp pilus assembly protein TadD